MTTRPPPASRWAQFHQSLPDGIACKYREQVQKAPGMGAAAFYKKISSPGKRLSIAGKKAIAKVYHLKELYSFPGLAKENAHIL
jgi:hypothetical protein